MYKKIILPIDLNSENALTGNLEQIIDLVKAFDAKLYAITVVPDYGLSMVQEYFPKGWVKEIVDKSKISLKKIVTKHFPKDFEIECIVKKGPVYQCIIDKAIELEADLIMIPAHRPELQNYLLGPNAAKVVRHASVSVLVLRN
jgi:nucleotide-binding universal stress UspA family protein